jgi:hypothetical protein
MKNIIVKDGGIDKKFIIKKAKGMASFNLFMDIVKVIEKAEGNYALIAQSFLHNCMQTGIEISGVKKDEAEKAIRENSDQLMYFIFNSFFRELDENSRNNILEQIFQHVLFDNGGQSQHTLTAIGNPKAEHIDLYIDDVSSILHICQEFVRLNYSHFFPKTNPSSPEDLTVK